MLTFHLKSEFYEMVITKKKKTEYREYKKYWKKRFSTLRTGDKIKIVNGYTKQFVYAEIEYLDILSYSQLPVYVKNFYYKEYKSNFYALYFRLLEN